MTGGRTAFPRITGTPASYVRDGQYAKARALYARLERSAGKTSSATSTLLIQNDLAVLAAMEGKLDEACQGLRTAVESDGECLAGAAQSGARRSGTGPVGAWRIHSLRIAPAPEDTPPITLDESKIRLVQLRTIRRLGPIRVAVLSFFSTGRRPAAAICIRRGWSSSSAAMATTCGIFMRGIRLGGSGGLTDDGLRSPARRSSLPRANGTLPTIRERFRRAVDSFAPDYVVISDTWNMKPHLAEAMRGYPYFLFVQAQECLCPLNNLRLLGSGRPRSSSAPAISSPRPRFATSASPNAGITPAHCIRHERALAGVGTAEYDRILRQSFYEAEAVLVLNPITAAMLEPYARRVCIVPWGIDPAQFPGAGNPKLEVRISARKTRTYRSWHPELRGVNLRIPVAVERVTLDREFAHFGV